MLKSPSPWPLLAVGVFGLTFYAIATQGRGSDLPQALAQPGQGGRKPTPRYAGIASCVQCHTKMPLGYENHQPLLCRCIEVAEWKDKDKHQDAYTVLTQARAAQMGQLLKMNVRSDPKCLSCHAVWIEDRKLREESLKAGFKVEDGVSCYICHGPYKEWGEQHGFAANVQEWRGMSREQKETQMGMRDLWNPIKRAELCASCHIGSREAGSLKVVTHEMYAAGHPPLPGFEVATFSDQMPRHWQYLAEKPEKVQKLLQYDGHAERAHLSLVGTAVAFRESMKLLEAEAAECTQADGGRMLDLVHFDCYACHHDLRSPSWRQ